MCPYGFAGVYKYLSMKAKTVAVWAPLVIEELITLLSSLNKLFENVIMVQTGMLVGRKSGDFTMTRSLHEK